MAAPGVPDAPTETRAGRAPLEQTPRELVPRLNEYTNYTKAHFQKVVLLPPFSADPLDDPLPIDEPLDLEDVSDQDSGIGAAVEGVVLVHEQSWRRKGLALGHLLHSLTLAPGEATRIAMLDWSHSVRGTADETTLQRDASTASELQTRALQEVTTGTALESQHGLSEARADAHSVQAGLSMLGISLAVAASSSIATTATSSDAMRVIGVRENHDVHLATEQNAEAARTRRATVVREVVESGQAQASTRVVANYNHMHALTVLYFEVVEVYDVRTTITGSKPCIFVPMVLKDGAWLLRRHPTVMASAADAVGMTSLAATIRALPENLPLRREPPVVGPLLLPVNDGIGAAAGEVDAAAAVLNPVVGNATSMGALTMTLPAAIANPSLSAAAQSIRDQARSAGDALGRALTAVTTARETVTSVPAAGLPPQTAAQLAAVVDGLGRAATTLTTMAADVTTLTRTAVRPTPRIDPPPPQLPPTADEFGQMATLAAGVLGAVGTAQAALTAARAAVTALVTAAPAPQPDTTDEDVLAKVARRIDEYREYFNQVVWSEALTPRVVHLLLRDRIYAGKLVNDVIDPTPVAIIGNMVGFTTTSGEFLSGAEFAPMIDTTDALTSEMALPTGGVFAEAVLGEAVSAERIDLTRFWDWKDSPVPLLPTEITPVDLVRSPTAFDLGTGRLDPTSATLRSEAPQPAASGTGDLLGALRDGSTFRDMSGIDAAKEVALKAMETAGSGSQDAARNATEGFKAFAELVETVAPMVMTGGASTLLGGLANNADDD